MTEKKITRATLKSFIRKNRDRLYIQERSRFDPMTDGIESINRGFVPVKESGGWDKNTLGIRGLWLVGGRDYFSAYDDGEMRGISISNCCGSQIIAIKK